MVEIKVRGGRANKAEKKEKSKVSNFLLTMSTNQRYAEDDKHVENDTEMFEETVKDILNNLSQYVDVIGGDDHEWSNKYIDSVDCDYVVEKGPKTGALHAHILLKLKHKTKIRLNYAKIKTKVTGDLGLDNIYMLNKLVRPTSDDYILQYISHER